MDTPPHVKTSHGTLRGVRRDDTIAFLGVPFAKAPVGSLRFAAPMPPEPWEGVRDAVEYGPTTDRVPIPDHLMPETVVPGDATLNLNVFIPAGISENDPAPVMVWFHGGGFLNGSPKNTWYEGSAFTRDGVIVVTVDYRLGLDGFAPIDGAPHNRGVLDWIAALEWVQREIAHFGGDPARVTIAGQSAGGGAVLTLLGMPRAQHLFRAVISLSGALGDVSPERAARLTRRVAALAHVTPDRAGLSSIPEQDLLQYQTRAINTLAGARLLMGGTLPTGPMIDGELLPSATLESFARGVGGDKPLLIMSTDHELNDSAPKLPAFLDRVPRRAGLAWLGLRGQAARHYLREHRSGTTRQAMGQYASDTVFRRLVVETAAARGDAKTWTARFSWRSPTFGIAMHCVDMPFFFDVLHEPSVYKLVGADAPQHIADELHGAAVAFIRGEELAWPAWTSGDGSTRVFDDPTRTQRHGYRDVEPVARPAQ